MSAATLELVTHAAPAAHEHRVAESISRFRPRRDRRA